MNYDSGYSLADIAAATGNGNNNNSGFGNGDSWFVILFLLVLFGGWGNRGFGGFGGNGGGTSVYEGYVLNNDFSQLSKQISDTYNMTDRKFDAITNGICSLGYQELQNINGVNTNIANGVYGITNAITTNGYETRIGINGIGTQLASCLNKFFKAIKNLCTNNYAVGSIA